MIFELSALQSNQSEEHRTLLEALVPHVGGGGSHVHANRMLAGMMPYRID
jgi:hypothetical protein